MHVPPSSETQKRLKDTVLFHCCLMMSALNLWYVLYGVLSWSFLTILWVLLGTRSGADWGAVLPMNQSATEEC